ncbi:MAG: universal stress protein, partial [Nitrospira sp.]|nr:universal stress protein [Nitrospira sp.]
DGYAVTTEVQSDHVIDTILRIVTFYQPNILVVGSRGLSGRERLQLGSVSETLLKYATCSVLIVRSKRV